MTLNSDNSKLKMDQEKWTKNKIHCFQITKKKNFYSFFFTNFKYEQILFFSFFSFALVLAQFQF